MANRRNFFSRFKNLKVDISNSRNRKAGELWLRLQNVLLNGNYSTIKKSNDCVRLWLGGYNDEVIGMKMNIKENSVRLIRKNISDELYDLLGDDFFELFEDFEKNESIIEKKVFMLEHLSKGKVLSVAEEIPLDVYSMIRTELRGTELYDFNLDDCKGEINFLRRYSRQNIIGDLHELNLEKVRFLLEVAEGKAGSLDTQYEIFKAMEGIV